MRFSKKMSRLGTETAFEVLAAARALEAQGRDVVHLEIGEPDFDTPANIVDAAVRAPRDGQTHYTPAAGIPDLRRAIASEVSATRGIEVDPAQVVVVPGGKPIMYFVITALVEEGDEVVYPNPGFPIYESRIKFAGGTPVPMPLLQANQFRLDTTELESLVTDRTRLIILNSPANPTGGVLTRGDLEAVARVVRDRDVVILADEIYGRIIYEGEFSSISSLPGMAEKTVILDGFSKTYAMTGWRLGYGVMPVALAEHVTRLQINSNSCTSAHTQWAGVEALTGPQDAVGEMVAAFRQRRDVIVDGLNNIPGIRCLKPSGAFYVFPDITGTGLTSKQMETYLLNDAGVATLAGTSFGAYGEGHIRLSYANSVANIEKALRRIRKALAGRA